MVRRCAPAVVCLSVLLFAIQLAAAGPKLHVNEATIRLLLEDERSRASLELDNATGGGFDAAFLVELLDPKDAVRASATFRGHVRKGRSTVVIPTALPFPTPREANWSEFPLYRLRYSVTPDAAAGVEAAEGVVSVSEVTPDLFELRVVSAKTARPSSQYRARVRAANPATQRGVRDVAVEAEMRFEGEETVVLKARGATDADGYAQLEFALPRKIEDDGDAELKVTARRGGLVQVASEEVDFNLQPRVLLTTDKSLYQPGQTLHARALVFDGAERAMPGAEVTLKVKDVEGTDVFRKEVETSRFGVASADWQIPASTRLGEYTVEVETEDEEYPEGTFVQLVKISRYDLPNFSVTTKNDRAFYLAGQQAEVEVRADYLFGQPVKRGRARVVRQTERSWNYKEQKYETSEGASVEGVLDAEGRFVARLDLTEEHEELAESGWRRFEDVQFAAYVTDPTTERTEQRRFTLRLTRDPIHVYVYDGRYRQAPGLPLAFYVSTFYADGTPAQCEVSVVARGLKRRVYRPQMPPAEVQDPDRTLLKVRTNRYGVAKAVGPPVEQEEGRTNLSLHFVARDGEGRRGTHSDDFWLRGEETPELRVETDKTIYREGQPVAVEVTANRPRLSVVVDAAVEGRVVSSRTLRLSGGRASFVLPYDPEFKGQLTVSAITTEVPPDRYEDYVYGARQVVYPRDRELKLEARMSRASYKPGEDAGVEFAVRAPGGRKVESALGVVVFDRAVEERARTEQEFGSAWGFGGSFYHYRYGSAEIAGITRRQIEQLNLSGTPPAALDEVAEVLFNTGEESYRPNVFGGTEFETDHADAFRWLISARLKPLTEALAAHYERHAEHPSTADDLARILSSSGVSLAGPRDPWGSPFIPRFFVNRADDVLELWSAGADERAGTDDDFTAALLSWPYFKAAGEKVNRAAVEYHKRTGGFVRDRETLAAELRRLGLELETLRDRWGQPYRLDFGVNATYYSISFESAGPNKVFEADNTTTDDFVIWHSMTDYFTETRARLDSALDAHVRAGHAFPRDEGALREALRKGGLQPDELRDGWGRRLYANFGSQKYYGDRLKIEGAGRSDARGPSQRTNVEPVTRTIQRVELRSDGADAKRGTVDDFTVGYFTSIGEERAADDLSAVAARPVTTFSGGTGAITGTVTDPIGAVVPGATVTAKHNYTEQEYTALTDDEGKYLLRNLPSGVYTMSFSAPGFTRTTIVEVRVQSSNLTRADMSLSPGGVQETVTVSAGKNSFTVDGTSSQVSKVIKKGGVVLGPQVSTPRLREFFPETLVWNPELTTDAAGRAKLNFKLADNITTWKLSVIASTEDGQLGTFEQEFKAFQPFFVEHEPPRVLTEGDEISLPVVLRNYLERAQGVDLEMKPEPWFALTGPARRRSEVASGDAARPTFDFRAVASVNDGKQRVTAYGTDASDAIEKPVTVHPDGEERSQTSAAVFGAAGALDLNVPAAVINGSLRAELKIYPNLAAHVFEGVEGIMRRPYGCGEQTISSAYPSVLVLNHAGASAGGGNHQQVLKLARRYAQEGYERLLNYRAPGGGFTYWGRGEPDLALTAYALQFLTDAGRVVEVDGEVLKETLQWLVRQQRADGSWPAYGYGEKDDARRTALTTAYVARVLARTGKNAFTTEPAASKPSTPDGAPKPNGETLTPLARALRYLSTRIEEADEPYLIASYALARLDAGERAGARRAVEKLRALAKDEGAGSFWSLETNTPFYGWGLAGRVETTALAVQAIARYGRGGGERAIPSSTPAAETPKQAGDIDTLVNRGLLFLLHKKDRYGVWYSTQATVNVLDTLLALVADEKGGGGNQGAAASAAEVVVNGRRAGEIPLPPAGHLSAPLLFDLSPFVAPGDNRVVIRRAAHASQAQAQAVATYYVPWAKVLDDESRAADGGPTKRTGASTLRLNVSFDRASGEVGQEINCRVEAERVGHRGYGMLLAEVGLPPGADVDRGSLERTMKESGYGISSYDVLPDRLVVYLWPQGGGTKFNFKFRPRFGLNAQSAASQLYDYYNPEARAVVPPSRFVIR